MRHIENENINRILSCQHLDPMLLDKTMPYKTSPVYINAYDVSTSTAETLEIIDRSIITLSQIKIKLDKYKEDLPRSLVYVSSKKYIN